MDLQFQNDELKAKYKKLAEKVTEMMDCQQQYFKSKNYHLLIRSKQLEKEVRDILNPKEKPQLSMEFLGR